MDIDNIIVYYEPIYNFECMVYIVILLYLKQYILVELKNKYTVSSIYLYEIK